MFNEYLHMLLMLGPAANNPHVLATRITKNADQRGRVEDVVGSGYIYIYICIYVYIYVLTTV